ncbi:hypothetical protein P7C70_g5159, partial [Phenoliferia sp. Uapishka_3]
MGPTPIADGFLQNRPSLSLQAHHLSPNQSPPQLSPSSYRAVHRSSVSIKPTDDPFASKSELALTMASQPLGGEEWRISEEGSNASREMDAESGGGVSSPNNKSKLKLERRSSFIKGFMNGARRTKSSSNLSTTSISNPIIPLNDPPRLAPLRTSASLVSFPSRESIRSIYSTTPGSITTVSPGSPPHRLPRVPPPKPTEDVITASHQSEGVLPGSLHALPPTTSLKAFNLLGGPKLPVQTLHATDRSPGNRRSTYSSGDELGLALTTDEPTRYITPDNRMSVHSSTSNLTSSSRNTLPEGRSVRPQSSYGAFSIQEEDEDYDPANEDGDPCEEPRQDDRLRRQASFPPPNGPIPPLPTVSVTEFTPDTRPAKGSGSTFNSNTSATPPALPSALPPPVESPYSQAKTAQAQAKQPWLRRQPSKSRSTSSLPLPTKASNPGGKVNGSLPPAHTANAVQRFWRPEVLGYSVTGQAGLDFDEMTSLDGERTRRGKGSKSSKRSGPAPAENLVKLSKEEVARIKSKAMKLAFNRDVEIVASTTQPPSTLATFSFTVPSAQKVDTTGVSGATANAWDSALDPVASVAPAGETQYYASCLLVWSHADALRSESIRNTLAGGSRAKSDAIQKAVKAASAGKKLGRRLAAQLASPMGAVMRDGRDWRSAGDTTDGETDGGYMTESEWGDNLAAARPLAPVPASVPFWLPFSLVLVSQTPLYDLLSDVLRISWARYHQDIQTHSRHMAFMLNQPCPRPGEKIRLPVSASAAQSNTHFVARMPGAIDWDHSALDRDLNFTSWPLFRCLDADTILSIAEVHSFFLDIHLLFSSELTAGFLQIALAPMGRVLFISSHSVMLGIATSVFKHILEQRGWRGPVHSIVHSRDLRIYVEDPGPWLLAIPSQSRFIALGDLHVSTSLPKIEPQDGLTNIDPSLPGQPEIAVVDLDSNSLRVKSIHPGALSTGSTREKMRKRLTEAIGNVSPYFTVSQDLFEAFPAGRFRPFSDVEVDGQPKEAERLRPAASWDWDQKRTFFELDAILKEAPRSNLIAKIFRTKTTRKVAELAPSAKHVQSIVRRHATTFVDRRDLLEGRVNSLNSKLSRLMAESAEWQESLEIFQSFSDKLTKESSDLKTRLEKERREARRLTGQVGLEQVRQEKLQLQLRATNNAREQALEQLSEVRAVRTALEQQRNLLMSEMQNVLAADESGPIYEAIYSRLEAISHRSDTSSRPGTSQSVRSGNGRSYRPVSGGVEEEEDDEDDKRVTEHTGDGADEDLHLDQMKAAVHEALSSIQSRLAIVLQNAEHLELHPEDSTRTSLISSTFSNSLVHDDGMTRTSLISSNFSNSMALDAPPDTPPSSASTSPDPAKVGTASYDDDHAESTPLPEPHRFKPKPFRLTPPVSPENDYVNSQSFVTTRKERRMSRQSQRHQRGDSVLSSISYLSEDTPTTATPAGHFPRFSSPAPADRPGSVDSFGVVHHDSYDTSSDAESFVSFEDAGFASPESAGSFSEDEATEGLSTSLSHVLPPRSMSAAGRHFDSRGESPVEGSVELFTRTSSIRRRSGALQSLRSGSVSRPASGVTVRAA